MNKPPEEINFTIDFDQSIEKFRKNALFIGDLVLSNSGGRQLSAITEGLAMAFAEITRSVGPEVRKEYMDQFKLTVKEQYKYGATERRSAVDEK